MRNKAISTFYALPCLVSAAALYSANKLRKQNKALQRRERIHQAQMNAYERCLAEVDLRNNKLQAMLEGCRQGRARDARENEKLRSELLVYRLAGEKKIDKLKEELAECKEQLEHLECHYKELKADEQAARRELEECRERADILENCVKMGLADQHRAEQERDAVKLELEQVRSASRDIIDETMRELELVYEWIRACSYQETELQNTLQQEFHGNVPSEIYRRKKNEQKMQAALASEE